MTESLKKVDSVYFHRSTNRAWSGLAFAAVFWAAGCDGTFPLNPGQPDNPTEFSGIEGCATSFSDSDFNYGFDVPADAELVRTKNESNSLTNSLWTFSLSGALVNVITRVEAASGDDELGSLVSFNNDLAVSAGADLLLEEEASLSNNGMGIQTVVRFDGLTTFRVQALMDAQLITVEAIIEESARTADTDSILSQIVLSLCLGS